jgi:hypothetical protein
MNAALTDNRQPWETGAPERPAGLEIVLLKRTFVLPWNQFLYAEGGDDEIRVAFTTHDVLIKRVSGLNSSRRVGSSTARPVGAACQSGPFGEQRWSINPRGFVVRMEAGHDAS